MKKWFFFSLLVLFVTGCSNRPKSCPCNRPIALVSIAPYQHLVERIAGPYLSVQTIVPQNTNPHAFEPTARQVLELAQGVVWFRIGEPFEDKILPIMKERNHDLWILDLREGIDLIPESADHLHCHHCAMEHLDRHIWMSPKLTKIQVEAIVDMLRERFPEHALEFEQNGMRLLQDLTELDLEIAALLEPVQKRQILVSHPAFGYFCRDYGIEQLSVEYEGKDPRPRHLEKILDKAVENTLQFSLALPQYNNKGAQLIAERLHVPVKWIDPYSPDYFDTMRHLAHLIADSENDQ
ncbi:MAG: zinc ABC transporter substrate-binding protein [Chlamydiia bacterium]|nr:zinc ABC transporter substrate-binding protein [Chlamydiia bacterium]